MAKGGRPHARDGQRGPSARPHRTAPPPGARTSGPTAGEPVVGLEPFDDPPVELGRGIGVHERPYGGALGGAALAVPLTVPGHRADDVEVTDAAGIELPVPLVGGRRII